MKSLLVYCMKQAQRRLPSCLMDIDPGRIPMVNVAAAFAIEGISAFHFDFDGNGESKGSFQYGNYYREVDDLRAVIQYFKHEKHPVAAVIGTVKVGTWRFYMLRGLMMFTTWSTFLADLI